MTDLMNVQHKRKTRSAVGDMIPHFSKAPFNRRRMIKCESLESCQPTIGGSFVGGKRVVKYYYET